MAEKHRRVDDDEFTRSLIASIERTALGTIAQLQSEGTLAESSGEGFTTIQVAVPVKVTVRFDSDDSAEMRPQGKLCCTCSWDGDVWVCRGVDGLYCCPDDE